MGPTLRSNTPTVGTNRAGSGRIAERVPKNLVTNSDGRQPTVRQAQRVVRANRADRAATPAVEVRRTSGPSREA
ncbi:hypothetical protein GCM10009547_30490 [Sporichthya brevicatena]|uniref:Uncharacterized protein n=1 Tax=Sporichthya brevicatena TaxID=171442 RepID=A0ABN1H135_9ACTN